MLAGAAVLSIAACSPQPGMPLPVWSFSDPETARSLVGAWEEERVLDSGVVIYERTHYQATGYWNGVRIRRGASREQRIVMSGKWKVRGGHVYREVESSTDPSVVPIGFAATLEVVSVIGDQFDYVGVDGTRGRAYRVNSQTPIPDL